jgi:hypothetical protein
MLWPSAGARRAGSQRLGKEASAHAEEIARHLIGSAAATRWVNALSVE